MNLDRRHTILLYLLRSGLWQEKLEFPEDFHDWTGLMQVAINQSVAAIVAKTILNDKEYQSRIPNDFRIKLKSFLVSNVMAFNGMTDTLKKVSKALADAEIPAVLLKGHSLAVHYPYPELRQCGDIDLYVGMDNSLAAHKVLSQIAGKIEPEVSALYGKHFDASVDKYKIEVHRHTSSHTTRRMKRAYEALSAKGMTEDLGSVTFGDVTVATPQVDFYAYYIFDHLFEHFLISGVGLRHLTDMMLFLKANKERINKDNLKRILDEMDMMLPWQVFGSVLVSYLGMDKEDFPFYAHSDKESFVLKYILSDGNFGKTTKYYKRRSKNYLLTKLNAIWCHITRGVQMVRVFPQQEMRHFHRVIANFFEHLRGDMKMKKSKR